ncbi:extracellular solute-binding protein [Paenibacillus antri]|uniref:Extracellular solute-binding protein n=1 Tax=Paenibacillus antri TaxID=2582848 RepID=A0A5R9GBW1_9BACL|nr:extracellular solute-binding protein [Paenibacillus antri]TLS50868.1 extracellular solute-binding protein [Paenibacillus antri]
MNTNKSAVTLLLAFVMAFMAACSGGGATSGTDPAEEAAPAEKPAEPEPVEEEPAEEPAEDAAAGTSDEFAMDFDLGGREIKVTAWWDIKFEGDHPDVVAIRENIDELQKKHNFTVSFVTTPYDKMVEQFTSSVMAGEPFADVVRLERRAAFPGLVTSGMMTPLNDIMDVDGPQGAFIPELLKTQVATFNGKLWGFERSYTDFSGIYYNKNLLKDLGIKDLHEYVEEGNWTWDTFMEVAKQAVQGGKKGYTGSKTTLTSLAVVSNGGNYMDLETGKEMLTDPRTLEAFSFVQEMYKSDAGDFEGDIKQKFTKGEVLMIGGVQWEGEAYMNELGFGGLGFVPFPLGPQGTEFKSISNPPNFWVIPKGVKDADKIVYLMDKIWDIESTEEYPNQNRLEAYFADEKDIQAAIQMGQSPAYTVVDNIYIFPTFEIYKLLDQLTIEMLAPATIAEQHKQVLQAAIDDALKQP